MTLSCAAGTNVGLRRNNNEDNFSLGEIYLEDVNFRDTRIFTKSYNNEICVCGVFDGMGGESLGEEASAITARVMSEKCVGISDDTDIQKLILDAISESNKSVCMKIIENNGVRIGSTFTALTVSDGIAVSYNVGDSRVYMMRDEYLTRLSVDDTVVQRLISLNVITPDEAKTHKDRNKLIQHLGIFPNEMIIEPHISSGCAIADGDIFLLCSDGLTDMVDENEIAKILSGNKSVEIIVKELIEAAISAGGRDNVTAIVVRVE